MDTKPIHSFEISVKKVGLSAIFSGKPALNLHENGMSWQEGSVKKFIEYSKISALKVSRYYSVLTIIHTGFGAQETKKLTLLVLAQFESAWKTFSAQKNINLPIKVE